MTPETNDMIQNWIYQTLLNRQSITSLSYQDRYNRQHVLRGYLNACESFGHITQDEASVIYAGVTGDLDSLKRQREICDKEIKNQVLLQFAEWCGDGIYQQMRDFRIRRGLY
jgi:hypothetical protein